MIFGHQTRTKPGNQTQEAHVKKYNFEKVAKTAYGPAYARTFTKIPYATEVRNALLSIIGKNAAEQEGLMMPELVPFFEARYLMTDRLLAENGATQVLEIGAGLSFRGIRMTSSSRPVVDYTEVDQPIMVALKRRVMKEMAPSPEVYRNWTTRQRWELRCGNALNLRSLASATHNFSPYRPIAVVNEGLMTYFTHEEKAIYARNIRHLLRRFGGVWITPDIYLKNKLAGIKNRKKILARWARSVNRDLSKNRFEDEDEAHAFFEAQGLAVERHLLHEINERLVSPERLGLTPEQVWQRMATQPYFVMRLK
jgi:O-methyltransferase involved in polyketide biosynthesis